MSVSNIPPNAIHIIEENATPVNNPNTTPFFIPQLNHSRHLHARRAQNGHPTVLVFQSCFERDLDVWLADQVDFDRPCSNGRFRRAAAAVK